MVFGIAVVVAVAVVAIAGVVVMFWVGAVIWVVGLGCMVLFGMLLLRFSGLGAGEERTKGTSWEVAFGPRRRSSLGMDEASSQAW